MAQEKGNQKEIYITNSFSPSMINGEAWLTIGPISPEEARNLVQGKQVQSFVGHEVTAQMLSTILGTEVKTNRAMLSLGKTEEPKVYEMITMTLLQRLPEGVVLRTMEEIQKVKYQLYYIRIFFV